MCLLLCVRYELTFENKQKMFIFCQFDSIEINWFNYDDVSTAVQMQYILLQSISSVNDHSFHFLPARQFMQFHASKCHLEVFMAMDYGPKSSLNKMEQPYSLIV